MSHRVFVSAAFGHYKAAGLRITRQARNLGVFDEVHLITRKTLMRDSKFWQVGSRAMLAHPTGYFLWKPYVIGLALSKCADNDMIFYCDAGCEFNPEQLPGLEDWFRLAETSDLVTFDTGCDPVTFCKVDVLRHFFPSGMPPRAPASMTAGTLLILRNSPKVRGFVQAWYRNCLTDNFHLIDDSPSLAPEPPTFRTHRHDQSILDCMIATSDLTVSRIPDTLWRSDWREAGKLPVLATRNRHLFPLLPEALQNGRTSLPAWKKILSKIIMAIAP